MRGTVNVGEDTSKFLKQEQVGVANGVAGLDAEGKIPSDQIPELEYAAQEHNHDASNIDSGTLSAARLPVVPVEKGGTGKSAAVDAANLLINALSAGANTPVDADFFISQQVAGGESGTTYYRRPISALWSYIKGKADYIYAALSHASRHAADGADPITPSEINAVNRAGDTMEGNLLVSKSYPQVILDMTSNGSRGAIQQGADNFVITNQNVAGDANNQRQLYLYNSAAQSNIGEAFRIVDVADGTYTHYRILHTGNVTASTTDITAGTSALLAGHQYLVYE